jgi:hypothetical protein
LRSPPYAPARPRRCSAADPVPGPRPIPAHPADVSGLGSVGGHVYKYRPPVSPPLSSTGRELDDRCLRRGARHDRPLVLTLPTPASAKADDMGSGGANGRPLQRGHAGRAGGDGGWEMICRTRWSADQLYRDALARRLMHTHCLRACLPSNATSIDPCLSSVVPRLPAGKLV